MNKHRTTLATILLLGVIVLIVAACSQSASGQGSSRTSNSRIRATWINADVGGDTVAIPSSEIDKNIMTHFKVRSGNTESTYMAYTLGGKVYVRADICPPCRSINFSLVGNTLVCDSCGTIFDATAGDGISGACVAYPKQLVSYSSQDGKLLMKRADLLAAYQNTQIPKSR